MSCVKSQVVSVCIRRMWAITQPLLGEELIIFHQAAIIQVYLCTQEELDSFMRISILCQLDKVRENHSQNWIGKLMRTYELTSEFAVVSSSKYAKMSEVGSLNPNKNGSMFLVLFFSHNFY